MVTIIDGSPVSLMLTKLFGEFSKSSEVRAGRPTFDPEDFICKVGEEAILWPKVWAGLGGGVGGASSGDLVFMLNCDFLGPIGGGVDSGIGLKGGRGRVGREREGEGGEERTKRRWRV